MRNRRIGLSAHPCQLPCGPAVLRGRSLSHLLRPHTLGLSGPLNQTPLSRITNGLVSLMFTARYGHGIGSAVELSSVTNGLMSLNDGYVPSPLMSPFCGLQPL